MVERIIGYPYSNSIQFNSIQFNSLFTLYRALRYMYVKVMNKAQKVKKFQAVFLQ